MCFSLVNGEYHRITGFLSDRWCMHADERNGTKKRKTGKSKSVVPNGSMGTPIGVRVYANVPLV